MGFALMANRGVWRERMRQAAGLLAFATALTAARSSLADHYQVPTGSMEPTIQVSDRVVVNKLAYGLRLPFSSLTLVEGAGPARGEVAVLRSPVEDLILIKRVVGVPGDEVMVRGRPVRLGPDEYLVVGDNRDNSRDGRDFGPVKRDHFLGRAVAIYWSGGRPVWRAF